MAYLRKNKSSLPGVDTSLTSIRSAILLLAVLIAATILGTVLPCRFFKSFWYVGLVLVLGLNVLVCTVREWIERKRHGGLIVIHLSLLLLIAGGLVSATGRLQGEVRMREGETVDSFVAGGKTVSLGFQLRLKDFELQKYAAPQERLVVHIPGRAKPQEFFFQLRTWTEIPATPYRFRVERFVSDFRLDTQTKQVFSASGEPRNPAVFVHVKGLDVDYGEWVFHRFPHFHGQGQKPVQLKYVWAAFIPKDFISHLEVFEGNRMVQEKAVRVNHPLKHKGFSIYQSAYDAEDEKWSQLQIVNDPGVWLVYSGLMMLLAGLVYTIYVRPFLAENNPAGGRKRR